MVFMRLLMLWILFPILYIWLCVCVWHGRWKSQNSSFEKCSCSKKKQKKNHHHAINVWINLWSGLKFDLFSMKPRFSQHHQQASVWGEEKNKSWPHQQQQQQPMNISRSFATIFDFFPNKEKKNRPTTWYAMAI